MSVLRPVGISPSLGHMTSLPRLHALLLGTLLTVSLVPVGGISAQQLPSATRASTRAELETAAAELDRLAASSAYGPEMIAVARSRATGIRRRLTDGDFRMGDRIALRIDGQMTVNDTLTVLAGPRLVVPGFRQISLQGVLRAELEGYIRAEIVDVVRDAVVRAQPLTRLAVLGAVLRPGYLSVPGETTIDDLLMQAGGPLGDAEVSRMILTRFDTVIVKAPGVGAAVAQRQTVGELDLADGDALFVPRRNPPWDRGAVLQVVGLFLTPILTIFVVRR